MDMVFDGGHCEAGWTWYLMVITVRQDGHGI